MNLELDKHSIKPPVTFIKDNITKRIFDIQGFRDLEYDTTLRIDNVNIIKEQLAETLIQTYENKDSEINSLVKLLSISPAELTENTKLSIESELILNQLNIISNRLDKIEKTENQPTSKFKEILTSPEKIIIPENAEKLSFDDMIKLLPNDKIIHERFGEGTVIKVDYSEATKADSKIEIKFNRSDTKRFLIRFMQLYKL